MLASCACSAVPCDCCINKYPTKFLHSLEQASMATFLMFFSQHHGIRAKYTEFAGSRSRKHLFVPSAVGFRCFFPKYALAPKLLRSLVWMVWCYMFCITISTPHQSLYLLWGSVCFLFWRIGQTGQFEWLYVCVGCTDHFTPQCWNSPLFTPAGQRLQSMPSTKTNTYTHPLCPLTFDTHSLHTLPSNADFEWSLCY